MDIIELASKEKLKDNKDIWTFYDQIPRTSRKALVYLNIPVHFLRATRWIRLIFDNLEVKIGL